MPGAEPERRFGVDERKPTPEQIRDWLFEIIVAEINKELLGPIAWITNGPRILLKTSTDEWIISIARLD